MPITAIFYDANLTVLFNISFNIQFCLKFTKSLRKSETAFAGMLNVIML